MNLQEARQKLQISNALTDESALKVIQQTYYPDMDVADLGSRLGVKMPEPAQAPRTWGDVATDVGITALKGTIGLPEAAVGMADIISGGTAGKALEGVGFKPKEAKEILSSYYSDKQKRAFEEVGKAEGVMGTMQAAIQNPSVIAHSIGESIPSMLAGGAIGRGVMAVAPRAAGIGAAAVGEGTVAAGSAAEQIRQQTSDGLLTGEQAALAGATGIATGALGVLGGKVAQKLGIADVDTMLVGATQNTAVRQGVVKSVLEGALSEGVLEELPQSISEQVLQNKALGKPLDEGVDQAAVLGLLSGAAMGGGANVLNSFKQPPSKTLGDHAADHIKQVQTVAEAGPMTRAANIATNIKAEQAKQEVDGLVDGTHPAMQAAQEEQAQELAQEQAQPTTTAEAHSVSPDAVQAVQAEQAQPAAVATMPEHTMAGTSMADMMQGRADPLANMVKQANSGVDMETGEAPPPVFRRNEEPQKVQAHDEPTTNPLDFSGKTDAELQAMRQGMQVPAFRNKIAQELQARRAAAAAAKASQPEQPEHVPVENDRYGIDHTPFSAGGKPFKTKLAADRAKKMQPMMRVVAVDGGFALADKTAKQIAAQAKAAKRFGLASVGKAGVPMAAHEFIASEGGLSQDAKSDLGIEKNIRIGNRTLYAGAGKGLSLEQATEKLASEGYIKEHDQNAALNIIRTSVTKPQYTPDGWESVAQAELETRYEDHLAAQDDFEPSDPFAPLNEVDLEETEYDKASEEVQAKVRALVELAEAAGIDAEGIMMDAASETQNKSEQAYYESANQKLETAINESTGSSGNEQVGEGDQAGQEPSQAHLAGGQDGSQDSGGQGDETANREAQGEVTGQKLKALADELLARSAAVTTSEDFQSDDGKKFTKTQTVSKGRLSSTQFEAWRSIMGLADSAMPVNEELENVSIRLTGKNVGEGRDYIATRLKYDPVEAEREVLSAYTPQEIEQRQAEQDKAEQARKKQEADAERKAQADAESDTFTLTGSDRPADVAAAHGQADIFSMAQEPEAEPEPKNAGQKWDGMTPAKRGEMLDAWAGAGQTDMADRYKGKNWDSFNVGERATLTAIIDAKPTEQVPQTLTTEQVTQKGRDDFANGVDRQTGAKEIASYQVGSWLQGWDEAKLDAKAKEDGKVALPSEFPTQEVSASYSGISHSGTERGRSERDSFVERVQELHDEAKALVETDAQQAALDSAINAYKSEYLSQTRSLMRVRAGTYSGFIAGRAKLNTKQADSRNSALDKAIERFTAWEKAAAPKVKAAVLAARTPEKIAQINAEAQAQKAQKEESRLRKDMAFMAKVLAFKSGDTFKVGTALVTKVNNDKDGYPLSLTIKTEDGSPLSNDKINLATEVFGKRGIDGLRAGKEKIRSLVDAVKLENSKSNHSADPSLDPENIKAMANGAKKAQERADAQRAEFDAGAAERQAKREEVGTPEWQDYEGVDVLRIKGSKFVAVPHTGTRLSSKFDIVDTTKRDEVVAQLKGTEVRQWLIAAKESSDAAATTQLKTVRDLADKMGMEYVSGLFVSSLKKGDSFNLNGKDYTAVTVTGSRIRFKSEDGKSIEAMKYGNNLISSGSKKTRPYDSLVRDIEGQITVDLINENNRFHTKSDIFKLTQKALDELPADMKTIADEEAKAPSSQNTEARKLEKENKPRKPNKAQEIEKSRADYFAVGNVVQGYGGFDEVLSYTQNDDGTWNVNVHAVKKVGDSWVRIGKPQDARNHSTQPDARQLQAGPVAKLDHVPAGDVQYTEPRTDGKPFPNAVDRGTAPQEEVQEQVSETEKAEEVKEPQQTDKPASKTPTVDLHNALMDSVRQGTASAQEFKDSFESVVASKEAIVAELMTKTKDELLDAGGAYFKMQNRNDNKASIADSFYRSMISEYGLGQSIQYTLGKDSYTNAIRTKVQATDDAKIAEFAQERKAALEELAAKRVAQAQGIADPKTIADFRAAMRAKMIDGMTRKEAFLSFTVEQRAKYDELEAEGTRESREERKRAAKTEVRAAGQTTGGEIIATKHTRDGYDLFVVQLADRVSREDYGTLLSSAKKLGGWYSSFAGRGAVRGFQFKEKPSAEAFLKLAAGDTTDAKEQAEQRRDSFEDDRSQTAVERLSEMAQRLEERADESLNAERKTNTARRAGFAASAEKAANADKAMAKTMKNIADAITNGKAKFLDAVRQKTQVEMLNDIVRTAKDTELRTKYPSYADQEKRKGEPPTAETADHADFPSFTAYRSDLASLARKMLEVDGTKKLGQQLMKVADDVSDAYLTFAKENILKVSQFGAGGQLAEFSTRDDAERAIKRSNLVGKAIVLPIKRGTNRVILSPSEAINRDIWKGDGDKRITLTVESGQEIVKAIGRRATKVNGLSAPWQFESASTKLKALGRMGIETPAEFRSALREFISMREQAQEADRVKMMERAMVGKKKDGLDFFPTPKDTADAMVEAAEITPDMAVLEPSAGMGHLADRIRDAGAEPDVIEMSGERRELLEAKGFNVVGQDFLEIKPRGFTYGDVFRAPDGKEGVMRGLGGMGSDRVRLQDESGAGIGYYNRSELVGVRLGGSDRGYDRIIMNPPFSDRRDAEHVMHAYSLLKPNGRLVAIMGEGVFFGNDKKAQAFREWLAERGGTDEKLAEGTFLDPSLPVTTGVNARMVVIDKPAGEVSAEGSTSRELSKDQIAELDQILANVKDLDSRLSRARNKIVGNGGYEHVSRAVATSRNANSGRHAEGLDAYKKQLRMAVREHMAAGVAVPEKYIEPIRTTIDFNASGNYEPIAPTAFSRQTNPAGGMSKEAAQSVVDEIRAKWANAPEVIVVESMDDEAVPQAARDDDAAARKSQQEVGTPEGFFLDGKVYIVASALRSHGAVMRVLFHESLGHYGLRGAFGDKLDPILKQIAALRKSDVAAKAKEYGLDLKKEGDVLQAAEEVLAEMAQSKPDMGYVKRAVAIIRGFLRKLGLKLELTDDDIVGQYLIPARAYVERGGRGARQGKVSFSRVIDNHQMLGFDNASGNFNPDLDKYWIEQGKKEINGDSLSDADYNTALADYANQWRINDLLEQSGWRRRGSSNVSSSTYYEKTIELEQPNDDGDDLITYEIRVSDHDDRHPSIDAKKRFHIGFRQNSNAIFDLEITPDMSTADALSNLNDLFSEFPELNDQSAPVSGGAMFSRAMGATDLANKVRDELGKTFTHAGKLSWWHKTFGSQYNLAEREPAFKKVFDAAQNFINDVSYYGTEAANMAPKILPKLETLKDLAKTAISAADNKAVAAPVFEGTLSWTRDADGKPVKIDDLAKSFESLTFEKKARMLMRKNAISEAQLKNWKASPLDIYESAVQKKFEETFLKAGLVWTDDELSTMFKLTPEQIDLYKEFRASTDTSLDNMAKAQMLREGGKDLEGMRDAVMAAPDVDTAAMMVREFLLDMASGDPDRADMLTAAANSALDSAAKVNELKKQGYAPLSRFGRFTVDVVVDGERQYFGLYETERDANNAAAKMRMEFGPENVEQGTMSQKEFELFQGITPESLELFGAMLGLDATGNEAQDKAFQTYLKLTKNNRSAMKRLIHRKGVAGYSEDVGRVLAAFVYANARQTSAALHIGEMDEAINEIPKGQGELKDHALELAKYVKEPQEEAAGLRGLMFAQYLGGSVASAMVNFTQPLTVSIPYLSQFGGLAKAGAAWAQAVKDMAKGTKLETGLELALRAAEESGVVSPQEVHQLMAQARGAAVLKSGDGTRAGDAMAKVANGWTRSTLAWGKLFGYAEQVNRRSTFIAAYRLAVENKNVNPAAFAEKAVNETQFINNKANKMKYGRGAIGATLMTFKSYSLNWLELMHRLSTQDGKEGKLAAAYMLGALFLMAGASGLPFAGDAEDLIDAIAQKAGYNFSSKKAKQEFLEGLFGKAGADFVDRGITGLNGVPIDLSGRMGMANLIPATGLLLEKRDHSRDMIEIAGPVGDMAKRAFEAVGALASGDLGKAIDSAAPRAMSNAFKGVDMANHGMYRDTKGAKVIDTTMGEAVAKMIGFQPSSVAQVQEANYINQRAKDFYTLKAQEMRAKWAQGIFEGDAEKVAEARQIMTDWNADNPDQKMTANMPSIIKRVREMRKDKAQRIADTAPKSMRAQMRLEARDLANQ